MSTPFLDWKIRQPDGTEYGVTYQAITDLKTRGDRTTLVQHPLHTNGQWIPIWQLPPAPMPAVPRANQLEYHPGVAGVLSVVPGLGHVYRQEIGVGLVWFVIVVVGYYCLIVPGLILHLICIWAAVKVR